MAGFRDVRALPARVRGSRRSAVPRPAERLSGAAARARGSCSPTAARSRARARSTRSRALPRRLADGLIVAIKGIGGFHLACAADDERRRRDAPRAQAPRGQAVRANGLGPRRSARAGRARRAGARPLLGLGRAADRPRRRAGVLRPVADAVAPGAPELGVMLPYTPLHHLLLVDYRALGRAARS